ncbi:MAG: hypothetical protein IPH53_22055 [Flavobacteriales bacterium]|nr:hypothetical protein [Flavobacteriales bacterium]
MHHKDNIKRQLDRFGYNYAERDQKLEVRLGYNLSTTIDLSQEGKVLLTDRLHGWNLLTGLVPTKDVGRAIRHTLVKAEGFRQTVMAWMKD